MLCPVCDNVKMREVDREGVTIDVCPQCKGVWLDRGELDKLTNGIKEAREDYNNWHQQRYKDDDDDDDHYKNYDRNRGQGQYPGNHPPYGKKKKKSFLDSLGDIFD